MRQMPDPRAQTINYHRPYDDQLRAMLRERLKDSSVRAEADALGINHVSLHYFLRGRGIKPVVREQLERGLGRIPTVVIRVEDGVVQEVYSTNYDTRVLIVTDAPPPSIPGLERVYQLDNSPESR